MGLFGKKEEKTGVLFSPVSGECIPLERVNDEAFASKLCGDGVALIPSENLFRSPCDGVVTGIAESKHAYTITSTDGLELLVHIGIDTVELKGEGFSPKVAVGDKVKCGDVLCEADIHFIREKGYDTTSPAVVSNMDEVKRYKFNTGFVTGGKNTVIEYTL